MYPFLMSLQREQMLRVLMTLKRTEPASNCRVSRRNRPAMMGVFDGWEGRKGESKGLGHLWFVWNCLPDGIRRQQKLENNPVELPVS
jgi:hypothetical protein